MKYYFLALTADEIADGTKIGYAYAKTLKGTDRWIENDNLSVYLTVGFVKGVDHIVHGGKAYMLMKSYIDIDETSVLLVCSEAINGAETRTSW